MILIITTICWRFDSITVSLSWTNQFEERVFKILQYFFGGLWWPCYSSNSWAFRPFCDKNTLGFALNQSVQLMDTHHSLDFIHGITPAAMSLHNRLLKAPCTRVWQKVWKWVQYAIDQTQSIWSLNKRRYLEWWVIMTGAANQKMGWCMQIRRKKLQKKPMLESI